MLTMLRYSPWMGTANNDDFWNEPSLSTHRFSIANMLLYTSQSLYEHVDVNSNPNKEYVPLISHQKKGSIHVANAAMAA
jgi:hypothetical protein